MKYDEYDMQSFSEAITMAVDAHSSQVDQGGQPYILHPLRVMLDVYKGGGDLSTVRAAVLHDVVEDTDILLDEVHAVLGDRTAILVDILTHAEGEPYKAFIERVAKSEDATLIKLADLRDNMDPSRITNKSGLYKRYAKAYWRLNMGAWPR